jgi:transcriptional regulator with XRE-family HTH domain
LYPSDYKKQHGRWHFSPGFSPMDAKLTFGQRLKAWRIAKKKPDGKKMTQDDLASASGLHRVAIANIERGSRGKSPPLETVVKLAEALGVSIVALTTSMPSDDDQRRKPTKPPGEAAAANTKKPAKAKPSTPRAKGTSNAK